MIFTPATLCRHQKEWWSVYWDQSVEQHHTLCVKILCDVCMRVVRTLFYRQPSWMEGQYYLNTPTCTWAQWRLIYCSWMTGDNGSDAERRRYHEDRRDYSGKIEKYQTPE